MDTDFKKKEPGWTEQVSFIIEHDVKPESHAQYEEWLKHIIAEAATFEGHMGTHVQRPGPGSDLYVISVRFANRRDAEQWANSATRKQLIRDLEPLVKRPEHLDIKTGIDFWFTGATGGRSPKRWKQWLVSVSVIWPLTVLVPWLLRPLFKAVPFLHTNGITQLVVALIVVFLVTYVVMPPYTRALSKWLTR